MSNNANTKNFNIVETDNSFDDINNVYNKSENANVVKELQGSIIISLTNDKNEIILCSDELYNLSPRFEEPLNAKIDSNNITIVKLKYNSKHFNLNDSELELNNDIFKRIETLEHKVEELINNNQDSNSKPTNPEPTNPEPTNPEDQLENENNN